MKKYIFLFLAASGSAASGQSPTAQKSITCDANTLSIHVSTHIDGEAFDHTIDISSLEYVDRLLFNEKIPDLFALEAPVPPAIPKIPREPKVAKSSKPVQAIEPKPGSAMGSEALTDTDHPYSHRETAPKQVFTKLVKFNPDCGELFLRYKYEKDGEEYEFERTVNAKNKSERERMQIVEETERELGLSIIQ